MPRKNNHNDESQREPTWKDVSTVIGGLEATYGGHVEVSLDVEGTRGAAGALWVRVSLWDTFQVHGRRPTDVVRQLWPTSRHKTMTGLVYRLLHQLDHAAEERLRAERADLPF